MKQSYLEVIIALPNQTIKEDIRIESFNYECRKFLLHELCCKIGKKEHSEINDSVFKYASIKVFYVRDFLQFSFYQIRWNKEKAQLWENFIQDNTKPTDQDFNRELTEVEWNKIVERNKL